MAPLAFYRLNRLNWLYTFRGVESHPPSPRKSAVFRGAPPNHRASRRCRERRQFAVSRAFGPTRPLNGYNWLCILVCLSAASCNGGEKANNQDGGVSDAKVADYDAHSGACLVSADCPPGFFCDLGICQRDCDDETACSGGTQCSPHGRCLASDEPDEDPEVTAERADELQVSPRVLMVERGQTEATLTVSSAEGGAFRFRAASLASWIGVSHRQVSRVNGNAEVNVTLERPSLDSGMHGAYVRIVSDIGTEMVPVKVIEGIGGRYGGTLEMAAPHLRTSVPFMLDLKDFGHEIWARISSKGSPLYGEAPAGKAEFDSEGNLVVTLTRVIPRQAPLGDWRTDPFGHPVLREVVLTLQVGDNSNMSGTYEETVTGILAAPFTVRGTLYLRREGDESDFGAFLVRDPPTVPNPAIHSQITPWCAQRLRCPDGDTDVCSNQYASCVDGSEPSCPSALQMAKHLLGSLPSVQQLFDDAQPTVNGFPVDEVQCCRDAMDAADGAPQDFPPPAPACAEQCYDPHLSECLQSVFEHHILTPPVDSPSTVHELALLQNLLKAGLFVSNESLVGVVKARINGMGIDQEVNKLNKAETDLAWLTQRVFTPTRMAAIQAIPSTLFIMSDYSLFRRLFRLQNRTLETLTHRANLERRRDREDANVIREKLQRDIEVAYLRGIAVAEVLQQVVGDPAQPELPEHANMAQALSEAAQIARGFTSSRNVLGLSPEYVPFLYRAGDQGLTNFEQVHHHVSNEALASAVQDEVDARTAMREFEDRQYAVLEAMTNVVIQYDEQLFDICGELAGEPDVANCGEQDGSLKLEIQSLEYEKAGVDLVETRLASLKRQIQIEEDRARAVSGVRDANIQMILDNGEARAAITIADSVLSSIQTFLSIASNSSAMNFGTPTGLGAISAVLQLQRGMLAAQKDRLQAMERSRMEAATRQIELINSAATVKNLLLQMGTVAIEAMMQEIRANQAASRIIAMRKKVQRLVATRDMLLDRAADPEYNPSADPSYRLIRDQSAERAASSFKRAMRWVYLTARAFEYETNTDLACIESDLFTIRTAAGLTSFMHNLMENFTAFRAAYSSPQVYVDEVSVREDIFGIKQPVADSVTGEDVSPQEQFRRMLLDPENMDGRGGVSLEFSTSVSAGNGVFSSLLCNDRIKEIQVMLVGDFLGDNEAGVILSQSGASIIRSCNPTHLGTERELVEYNIDPEMSSTSAGVNTYGMAPASTALYGRSVAFSSWRLTIPSGDFEPNNVDIALTHLDDIVIKVTHEALTVDDLSGNEYVAECR